MAPPQLEVFVVLQHGLREFCDVLVLPLREHFQRRFDLQLEVLLLVPLLLPADIKAPLLEDRPEPVPECRRLPAREELLVVLLVAAVEVEEPLVLLAGDELELAELQGLE